MDYLKFHELSCEPFQNSLDARFYFEGQTHAHARLRLERGLRQQRALLALIGAPGCGKSTLAHQLSVSLDPARYLVQLRSIPHSACAQGWLLPKVSQAFAAGDAGPDPARMLEQIHYALLVTRSRGRHPVLIIDEAQLLTSAEVMREFRGLLNLLDDGRPLLSLVLCGLPELDRVLELDPPLAQRVEVRCRLEPLSAPETARYIEHRLARATASGPVFDAESLSALAHWSGGVPRLLNTLADNALFESSVSGVRPVDLDSVLAAAEQLGLVERGVPGAPAALPEAAAASAAPAVTAAGSTAVPPAPAATLPAAVPPPRPPAAVPAAVPLPRPPAPAAVPSMPAAASPAATGTAPAAPASPPVVSQPAPRRAAPELVAVPAAPGAGRPAAAVPAPPAVAPAPAQAQPQVARPRLEPAAPPVPAAAPVPNAAPRSAASPAAAPTSISAPAAAPAAQPPVRPAPLAPAPQLAPAPVPIAAAPEEFGAEMLEVSFEDEAAPELSSFGDSAPEALAEAHVEEEDGFLDLGGLLELDPDPLPQAEPEPEPEPEDADAGVDLDSLFAQIQRPQ
jgi:general secretion pathway protein A